MVEIAHNAGLLDISVSGINTLWVFPDGSQVAGTRSNTTVTEGVTRVFVNNLESSILTFSQYTNNSVPKFDLKNLLGKLTYALRLTSLLITGDLADLQGKTAYQLELYSPLITGDLADLPRDMSYILRLLSPLITGDLADLPTSINGSLYLYSPLITGVYTPERWTTPIQLYGTGQTPSDVDATLIELLNINRVYMNYGTIRVNSRTSASDATVRELIDNYGWIVYVNNVLEI